MKTYRGILILFALGVTSPSQAGGQRGLPPSYGVKPFEAEAGVGATPLKGGTWGGAMNGSLRFDAFQEHIEDKSGVAVGASPSMKAQVRLDPKGNVQSYDAHGNIMSLVKFRSGFESYQVQPTLKTQAFGGTVRELKELDKLIREDRATVQAIENYEKQNNLLRYTNQVRSQFEKLIQAKRETNYPDKKSIETLTRGYEELRQKEVTEPTYEIQKKIAKLRSESETDCPYDKGSTEESCQAYRNQIRSEIQATLKGYQTQLEALRQHDKELDQELNERLRDFPEGLKSYKKILTEIRALEIKRDQTIEKNRASVAKFVEELWFKVYEIRDRVLRLQVKFDYPIFAIRPPDYRHPMIQREMDWSKSRGSSYRPLEDWERRPIDLRAALQPGITGTFDFNLLGMGYHLSKNEEYGQSRKSIDLHLFQMEYRKATQLAGLDADYCLSVIPVGMAYGDFKQKTTSPQLEGHKAYRFSAEACLEVQAGVLGKLRGSVEIEYLGLDKDVSSAAINGRAGVKNILGSPLQVGWEGNRAWDTEHSDKSTHTTHLFTVGVSTK